jgi:type II secretory pathway component HofQ
MEKEKLTHWIERLNNADKKDRKEIVSELCKQEGLKTGDAWKLLKEAGFDSSATPAGENQQAQTAIPEGGDPELPKPNAAQTPPPANIPPQESADLIPVTLRHKTEYLVYRRAGIVMTRKAEPYDITPSQLGVLKKDKWVEVVEK